MKGRCTGGKQKLITMHTPYMLLVRYLGKPEWPKPVTYVLSLAKNKRKLFGGHRNDLGGLEAKHSKLVPGYMQNYIQAISMD